MSQAISTSLTRLINFNYDFANCCVTIPKMTIKQDLRTFTNKFLIVKILSIDFLSLPKLRTRNALSQRSELQIWYSNSPSTNREATQVTQVKVIMVIIMSSETVEYGSKQ